MFHNPVRLTLPAALAIALCFGTAAAWAQSPPPAITQGASDLKRTIMQKFDVPGSNYETVIALVEIVPNGVIGKHTHFGIDSGVVYAGDVVLNAAGTPERIVKTGESWQIAPNTIHWGQAGANGAKIINTYVIEKGKPLATPAP